MIDGNMKARLFSIIASTLTSVSLWGQNAVTVCDTVGSVFSAILLSQNASEANTTVYDSVSGFSVKYADGNVKAIIPDTKKEVGQIRIIPGFSPTGAKTYDVPINVYTTDGCLSPTLSLSYNSQQGNGILGVGWSLSGLQEIARVGNIPYYDGRTRGVRMDNEDGFMLNGMRMIKISNATEPIYQTEQGNIKAKAHVSGNAIAYFEVYFPDGARGVFGFKENKEARLYYPLTSYTDSRGRSITYNYHFYNNHYNIESIHYGNASVEFEYTENTIYDSRCDFVSAYIGGLDITEERRLWIITSKHGNNEICKYLLGFQENLNKSFLSTIRYSSAWKEVNQINFGSTIAYVNYTYKSKDAKLQDKLDYVDRHGLVCLTGRFLQGSRNDAIATYPNKNPYCVRNGSVGNTYGPDETISVSFDIGKESIRSSEAIKTEPFFIGLQRMRLSNKNEDCIVKISNQLTSSVSQSMTFKTYAYTPDGALVHLGSHTFEVKSGRKMQPKSFFAGDFDGDGREEMLVISRKFSLDPAAQSEYYLFDIENDRLICKGTAFDYSLDYSNNSESPTEDSDRLQVLDFDGDGKMDVCLIDENGAHFYSFESTGASVSLNHIASYPEISKGLIRYRKLQLGDFNGDGLSDIFISQPFEGLQDNSAFLCISKGNGDFEKKELKFNYVVDADDDYLLQDVDGDGVSDIIYRNGGVFYTHLIKNLEVKRTVETKLPTSDAILMPTSINTLEGNSQLIAFHGEHATRYSFSLGDREEWLITMMTNSNGVMERNEYHTIGQESYVSTPDENVFVAGDGASFPYANSYEPIHVLASTQTLLGDKVVSSRKYNYKNAVLHRQGLGFRGFEQIGSIDERGEALNLRYDIYSYGELVYESCDRYTRQYSYDKELTSNKLLRMRLAYKSEKDNAAQRTTSTIYEYDEYGNLTKEEVTLGGNCSVTTRLAYANNDDIATTYHIGTLIEESVEKTNGNGTYAEKNIATSLTEKLLPTSVKRFVNGNLAQTTTFEYDGMGNVVKEATTPYSSSNAMVSRHEYDSMGRLLKSTDPYGLSSTYTYDGYGRLASYLDPLGNLTTYEYDVMGRLCKTNYPDGTVASTEYAWVTNGGDALYSVTDSMTGSSAALTEYDALGREVRSGKLQADGKWLYTKKEYDDLGRLKAVSRPLKDDAARQWTQYEYDKFDRVASYTDYRGRTVRYSYSPLMVVADDGRSPVTRIFDPFGNVEEVRDGGGTVKFALRPDGKPTRIEAVDGVTKIAYDGYGRRTNVNVLTVGANTTNYADNGEIASETNSRGETITYGYDNLNRLIAKTTPEFNTTYAYDGFNRTSSVSSTNGTSKLLSYDKLGRVETIRESLNGKFLQKRFAYSDGNVSSISYLSDKGSLGTEYFYYSNGTLVESNLNGNVPIFTLNAENNHGQTTEITTGPVTRSYGYTEAGLPSSRKATGFNRVLQNLAYSYDAKTGFMLSRTNYTVKENRNEAFGYDPIGRLVKAGDTDITYQANGNILKKDDYGEYIYGGYNLYSPERLRLTPEATPHAFAQDVAVTAFERPKSISNGVKKYTFTYNADYEHVCMTTLSTLSPIPGAWRYYFGGCYEADVRQLSSDATERLYLGGGGYYDAVAVLVRKNGTDSIYYIMRDNLGSITDIVSSDGSVHYKQDYDAWGKPRGIENSPTLKPVYHFLNRGYCGHEHLLDMDVINMNARLYDPSMGRFLSPDPYVANPYASQAYNRYSYTLNNPLTFVDRDGENPIAILGIIAGAYLGGVAANDFNFNPLKWDYSSLSTYVGIAVGGAGALFIAQNIASGGLSLAANLSTPYATIGIEVWQGSNGLRFIGGMGTIAGGVAVTYDKDVEKNVNDAIEDFVYEYSLTHYFENEISLVPGDAFDFGSYEEQIIPYPYSDPSTTLPWTEQELTYKKVKEIVKLKKGKRNKKPGYVYFLKPKKNGLYRNYRTNDQVYLTTKDIWKIGESTVDQRYRKSSYEYSNFKMEKVYFGTTTTEIKVMEKIYIYDYVLKNGVLPPGNRIFR